MTKEQSKRIFELWDAALDRSPGERDAFLEKECADEEVRNEVRSVLAQHDRARDFIEEPLLDSILPSASQPPVTQSVLDRIPERYEILAELGRGGMGVVFKARDRVTDELVALKVLNPETGPPETTLERFKNELRLAHKIVHRNVCSIRHFDIIDNLAYISMEYVEGETLRDTLTRFGGLPLRKGVEVGRQLCEGLQEAHHQGVIHRDLKPENIMIDHAGNAKIMDFGIARSLDASTTHSTAIGTPAYMAPEQMDGKVVDTRTDIFALGLILFEIFTGKKQKSEAPLRPRELEPALPVNLENVILRCLETRSADRFQSVGELESALTQSLQSDAKQGPSSSGSFRLLTLIFGQPASIARLIVFVALIATFTAGAFLLGRQRRAASVQDISNNRTAGEFPVSPMHHDAEVYSVMFSPSREVLASASEDKTIKLWNVGTQALVRTLLGHTRAVTSSVFSPDGRTLASASSDKTVKIWDLNSGQVIRTLNGHTDEVNSVAYSPNGHWLISGSEDKTVKIWDAETGELKRTLNGHTSTVESVCFSPDGRWIASAGYDETIRIWDAQTGAVVHVLRGHADRVEIAAFSIDSHWLASGGDDNLIKIWDVTTGQEFRTLAGHKGWVLGLSFSPDGARLASAGADGAVKVWEVATGRQLISLSGEVGMGAIAFAPDGSRVATGDNDGNVKLWSLTNQ